MISNISGFLAAVIILGSASIASAATVHRAVNHHVDRGSIMLLENSGRPVVGSYGGYSLDPKTRALEILSDEYRPGW